MFPVRSIAGLWGAIAHAWRSLIRRPGYFAIAVSSLAVALGLATTVIAHVDSLIHPDFGTPHFKQLHWLSLSGYVRTPVDEAALSSSVNRLPPVERAGLVRQKYSRGSQVRLGTQSDRVEVWEASREIFEAMGTLPVLGRWPGSDEAGVALITEETWRNRFHATDALDGIRVTVDGVRVPVVGVIRRNTPPFYFFDPEAERVPATVVLSPKTIRWPADETPTIPFSAMLVVRGRRGADSAAIATAAAGLTAQMQQSIGTTDRPLVARVIPFAGRSAFYLNGYQKAMMLAAGLIVLIACANVSALMLARAVAKRRDQALRLALGAERRHIVRDLAAEIAIVAFVGGVAGILIGDWSMRILAAVTPPDLPWLGFVEPHWSPWVFAALFGVVLLCVVIATLIPASFVSGISPAEQLKDNSGTTTGRPRRTFQVLVVGELALALILMFGAVLVAKTSDVVAGFDFGYEPHGLIGITANVRARANPGSPVPASAGRIASTEIGLEVPDQIVARLRREPGIRNAAWSSGTGYWGAYYVSDESSVQNKLLMNPHTVIVGPGFFQTLGLQLVAGRDFVETDRLGPGAAILDETSAARLFAGGDAVGKLIKAGSAQTDGQWIPVVGIVRAARYQFPDDPAVPVEPSVYRSAAPLDVLYPSFVVRGERGAGDVTPRAAAIVQDLLPAEAQTSTGYWLIGYDRFLKNRRFTAGMFLALSFASLVLAAAGLFGVLSYAVNQRMREFAVRVALGAQRGSVVKLVLRDGFVMALGGTAIGAVIAMYAAMSLWQWLWGVYPVDAEALVISEGILLAVTALGAILPSLRATRANPVDIMRAT